MNLLLAVSPTLGVVAYLVYPGSMNGDMFALFLHVLVLPALRHTARPHFLMLDNLRAHQRTDISQMVFNAGHWLQFRPTHSPDFSPVESCFHQVKSFLRRHEPVCRTGNLVQWSGLAVKHIVREDIEAYFAHCGYSVSGRAYRPYTGAQ